MTLRQIQQAHRRLRAASARQQEARVELREAVLKARRGKPCSRCDGSGDDLYNGALRSDNGCSTCYGRGCVEQYTLAEIGEALGMTRQGVYDILRRNG